MVPADLLSLEFWEILGLAGAGLYCGSYLLVALDRLTSASPTYYLFKLAGASFVLASLASSFNLASMIIQVFFVIVSLVGLYRHDNHRSPERRRDGHRERRRAG